MQGALDNKDLRKISGPKMEEENKQFRIAARIVTI
jgi:hypothetical protein